METRAFIFDMDGVVSDTQDTHSRIECELLAEYGVQMSPQEITRRFSGVSGADMFPQVFKEAGVALPDVAGLSDRKFARILACAAEIKEVAGTREFIACLHERNIPRALASGSRLAYIQLVLSTLALTDRFDAVASSEEVAHGKPAPDVFLLAAKRLDIEPQHCVVIEDGISGMIAAHEAGMRCIALARDGRRDCPAELIVRDLREVPEGWFFRR